MEEDGKGEVKRDRKKEVRKGRLILYEFDGGEFRARTRGGVKGREEK